MVEQEEGARSAGEQGQCVLEGLWRVRVRVRAKYIAVVQESIASKCGSRGPLANVRRREGRRPS